MQEKLREKVADLKAEGKSPIMEHNLFVSTFKELFEDEEELLEAVYFLHLQGEWEGCESVSGRVVRV